MEWLPLTAALALVMSTSTAMAPPSADSGCATPDPIVTTPPQDNCGGGNCVRPAPAVRVADGAVRVTATCPSRLSCKSVRSRSALGSLYIAALRPPIPRQSWRATLQG